MKKTLAVALVAAPALFAATQAQALFLDNGSVTVGRDDVSQSFQVNWLVPEGTGNPANPVDLTAVSTWTVTSFTDNAFGLSISLTNTTDLSAFPQNQRADLTSFGFATDPNSSVGSFTGGSTFIAYTEGNTAPLNAVDLCVYSGNNCAGAGTAGLGADQSDALSLTLTGQFGDSMVLSSFMSRWQTAWDSYNVFPTNGGTPVGVPEPGTLGLIGLGLLGLGMVTRRRQR